MEESRSTSSPRESQGDTRTVRKIATSVTGFFFPAKSVTPAHVVGVISLVILAWAVYARSWRWIYVATAAEFVVKSWDSAKSGLRTRRPGFVLPRDAAGMRSSRARRATNDMDSNALFGT